MAENLQSFSVNLNEVLKSSQCIVNLVAIQQYQCVLCLYRYRDGSCMETVLDHGADVYGMD